MPTPMFDMRWRIEVTSLNRPVAILKLGHFGDKTERAHEKLHSNSSELGQPANYSNPNHSIDFPTKFYR